MALKYRFFNIIGKKQIFFILIFFLLMLIPTLFEIRSKEYDNPISPSEEKKIDNDALFPSGIRSDHIYDVEEEETFLIPERNLDGTFTMRESIATCQYVSAEVYLFLDNNAFVMNWNFTNIGEIIDNYVIPILSSNFAEPTDIDSNDHIVIVFSYDLGYGGVVSYQDLTTNGYFGEITYITVGNGIFSNTILGIIIHELQHLVHYSYDPDEFRWFDEGCSMFSEFYLGYSLGQTEDYDLYYPNEISLLYWDYYNAKTSTDYQAALTFISYLQDQYGSENLSAIYRAQSDGVKLQGRTAIMEIINQYQPNLSFERLYLNWIVASTVDVYYSGDNRAYYYKNFICRPDSIKFPQIFTSESYPFNKTWAIDPWATKVYAFREYPNPNEINVSIEIPTDSQNHLFGINIIKEMKENDSINYGIDSFMLTVENISEGYQATLNATEDNFSRLYITISHLDGGEGFDWDIPTFEKNVMISLEVISNSTSEDEQQTTSKNNTSKQVTATIPYPFILLTGLGLKLLKETQNRRRKQ